MKFFVLILFLVLLEFFPKPLLAQDSVTYASDPVTHFAEQVKTLMANDDLPAGNLDSLLNVLPAMNWAAYRDRFGFDGPVVALNAFCRKRGFTKGVIATSNALGVMYRVFGEQAKASALHQQALDEASAIRDTLFMMISLNNLGVCSRRTDHLQRATDYHMEAIRLASEYSGNCRLLVKNRSIALNSLGNIYFSLNQNLKAIEFFRKANQFEKQMASLEGQAINHSNIGEAFEAIGQLDSAEHYYVESLKFNEQANSVLGIALSNCNIGHVELVRCNLQESVARYQKAVAMLKSTGDKFHQVIAIEGEAEARAAAGENVLAESLIQEAISISKSINARNLLQHGYQLLAKINRQSGNFSQAFDALTLAQQYGDSILNEKNQRHLAELQAQYDDEVKNRQIALLNKEQELATQQLKTQRLITLLVAILAVLGGALIFLIFQQQKIKLRNREFELSQRLLRSQMNPHFIFNSLGSIQSFMFRNDGKSAASYLGNFSVLIRSVLEQSRCELIPLEDEISTLRNYLILEQMRCGGMLQFDIYADRSLDGSEVMVPPMLVQPFVENAIKHAFPVQAVTNRIAIHFVPSCDSRLEVTVEDNGIGIDQANLHSKHRSVAIDIFKERLEMLGRKYSLQSEFKISDLARKGEKGTQVHFYLPLT